MLGKDIDIQTNTSCVGYEMFGYLNGENSNISYTIGVGSSAGTLDVGQDTTLKSSGQTSGIIQGLNLIPFKVSMF